MTNSAVKEIVRRAVNDAAYRAQLQSDPTKALAGVTLTAEERSAITSADPARLTALGVDQRMSKVFAAGALSEASKVVGANDAIAGSAAFIDEGTTGGTAAIISDPASAASSTLVHDVTSLNDLHMKLNEQDLNTGTAAADASGAFTGSAAPIDGSPEASALESAAAGGGTEHSANWRLEQDLDAGSSLESPSSDVQITGDETISDN